MATGDLKRSLRKLEHMLRLLNYPREVDYVGLIKGDTAASLPIISYSLTSYSPYVTELLMDSNIELIAKNDLRFTDAVYKLLRDQFDYKPILSKKQFIQCGFAEWKIQIVCDVLNCVVKKHKELTGSEKVPSHQRKKTICDKSDSCSSSEKTPAGVIGIDMSGRVMTSGKKKAVVIRHLYNADNIDVPEDTSSVTDDISEDFDESDTKTNETEVSEVKVSATKAVQQDINYNSEITALQTMLAECQEKLGKLTFLEKRLDLLEETMKGKVMVDEKTWNDLLSRVTLLETEMLLSKKNEYVKLNVPDDDYASVSDMDFTHFGKFFNCISIIAQGSSGYNTVSAQSTPRGSTINYCGLKDLSEETTIQKMERMKKM
uniref:Centrosomal protein of 44 kDa n=1 Tax=Jaculus jaculus TaxID=51337 RepID=A0A8C5LM31_JACJA